MKDNERQLTDELAVIRSWYRDAGFRDAVRRDPKAALEQYAAVRLPEHLRVHVHHERADEVHLVTADIHVDRTDMGAWQIALGDLFVVGHRTAQLQDVLRDPDHQRRKQKLGALLGVTLPAELAIHVHHETDQDVHISVPMARDVARRSAEDLSMNPRDFWIRTLLDLVAIAHGTGAPNDLRAGQHGTSEAGRAR